MSDVSNESELEYVGFWARTGASLIDTVIQAIWAVPLLMAFYGAGYWVVHRTRFIQGPADLVINWVLPIVGTIALWLMFGATLGKMAIGARIVDARSGEPMSIGQAIGRCLAYFVSLAPLGLGFFWVAIDSRKQGWHDKLAGTVVIRSKNRGPEAVRFEERGEHRGAS